MILGFLKKYWLCIMLKHIKSVLNKDQNHYQYNILLEKYSYHLGNKIVATKFFDSIIMLRFMKIKVAKETWRCKKSIKVWNAKC